jgi:hypothetical protein
MPKVIVAAGCREIDAPSGRRYYARGGKRGYQQGGLFAMSDADAKLAVRMGGAIASLAGTAPRSAGFRCPECDFGSWLRVCGRCGAECERE